MSGLIITTSIQQSANSSQQKTQVPNSLLLSDSEILNKTYLTHVKDDQECDIKTLYDLVSNVLSVSTLGTALVNITTITSFKPEFSELKLISSQMITTRGTAQCAHQTTLWILERLRCFSWDAKALITLAAFSLEYGEFLNLLKLPTSDMLGNSLKQLNQIQTRKNVPSDIIELLTFLVQQVLPIIRKWALWYGNDYDTEKVYSLLLATQEIPLLVYWTIAATVACTGKFVGNTLEYKLSEFQLKLSNFVGKLKSHLESCGNQIGKMEDYEKRIKDYERVKDVVGFLKLLIHGNGSQTPLIYEGSTLVQTGVEVFKQKHVLLFISNLESVRDEIILLNSIYKRLQENPKVVKGFNKEDFNILWVPVVDDWNDNIKNKFKELRKEIKWYVLEYFTELPGIGIIQEKLKYDNEKKDPIISLINPQGDIINENAKPIIFQWGIEAFPFRKEDAEDLIKNWLWLWKLIQKVDPNINTEDLTTRDHYFFIYGGNDIKWIQNFSTAMENIKKHEYINDFDLTIHHHQLGKDNPDKVSYFWIGIDGKKPKKKCQGNLDCEIQKALESLQCLKKDALGWVLLSKGYNIKLLGHGEPMLQTVVDFNKWKENVVEKESFDAAFIEYYDGVVKAISARCDNYTSDVLATIACPNPTCERVMELSSVNYSCCHRDNPNSCSITLI
ncbi:putative sieve element occlusion [Lupinus albus]|uniref:Putative sieve element occlusion n=1 Tax=Lupinus albus TaxID=3870 RepID=A0A6A4NT55_LUPAL|nr:putative sieve element occlusion [Lupinus albus]